MPGAIDEYYYTELYQEIDRDDLRVDDEPRD